MLRIYLDTNIWVGLTQAAEGHPEGATYEGALVVLREAVACGHVSLPLSMQHFMEAQHRSKFLSRMQLAVTMIELSRWHAIGPHSVLVAAELDRAVAAMFSVADRPRRLQAFGVGPEHAAGQTVPGLERRVWPGAIVGVPPEAEWPEYDRFEGQRMAAGYAAERERLRGLRRPEGFNKGERGRRAASAETLVAHGSLIEAAFERIGLEPRLLYMNGDQRRMDWLIDNTPSMYTYRALTELRYSASQKAWEANDVADVAALSVAIVYCDVVVTENLWTDFSARAGLGPRFGTRVLRRRDLAQLVDVVLGAAAAA